MPEPLQVCSRVLTVVCYVQQWSKLLTKSMCLTKRTAVGWRRLSRPPTRLVHLRRKHRTVLQPRHRERVCVCARVCVRVCVSECEKGAHIHTHTHAHAHTNTNTRVLSPPCRASQPDQHPLETRRSGAFAVRMRAQDKNKGSVEKLYFLLKVQPASWHAEANPFRFLVHTDTQTHRHTDTDTQTHRHTDTQTYTHTHRCVHAKC